MKERLRSLIEENRLVLPGMIIIGVLAAALLARWGYGKHASMLSEISAREETIRTYSMLVARGGEMKRAIDAGEKRIARMEKGLLKATNPSTGAAELQEAVKRIASRKRIQIRSENVLAFEKTSDYIKVPVQFQMDADMTQLTGLLYEIQSSPLLMSVRTININGRRRSGRGLLHVSLVVDGAIKRPGRK